MKPEVVISTGDQLPNQVADRIETIIRKSRDPVSLALPGGSTPQPVFRALARRDLDWRKCHFFLGDERWVPHNHEESNFRSLRENLLGRIDVPDRRIHPIETVRLEPEEASQNYEKEIRRIVSGGPLPRFELMFLGLGDDGHTASLFPRTDALQVRDRLVTANFVPRLEATRITMTLPLVNASRTVLFMVSGEKKAEALRGVLEGEHDPETLPAQAVKPEQGELVFMVDEAAAGKLTRWTAGP